MDIPTKFLLPPVFIYSEYCVRLDVRTSVSGTSNTCLLPVKGTLPHPFNNRSAVTNKIIIFVFIPLQLL